MYTIGIDRQDVYLWYSHNTVPITDIFWKLEDATGNFLNPLDVYSLTYYLNHIGDIRLECFDIESRNALIRVGLLVQGLFILIIVSIVNLIGHETDHSKYPGFLGSPCALLIIIPTDKIHITN